MLHDTTIFQRIPDQMPSQAYTANSSSHSEILAGTSWKEAVQALSNSEEYTAPKGALLLPLPSLCRH